MREILAKVTRRGFLQATAGAGAGAALSGITVSGVSKAVEALSPEVRPPDGPESWVATTCLGCGGACGLLVRKVGDRAVYVKGNPEHPVTRGGLCPRALAALQWANHPDRLRTPLRKVRKNNADGWEQISWDEALRELGERWSALRQPGSAESLVFLAGRRGGLLFQLMRRFLGAFPRARLATMPHGTAALEQALSHMQGMKASWALDLESARYVLNFGCNLLEGWGAPVATMRAFARWRDSGQGLRSKFVHVSPRLSVTGAKADEWVPVRPGTEPVLALGIAHALIAENLYNRDFVARNTSGFEDWVDDRGRTRLGFRSQVLRDYRLGDVAALTDVPVETILRLAREAAANPPALALGDTSSGFQPGSLAGSVAVHSLNLLTGSAATLVREAPAPVLPSWGMRDRDPAPSGGLAELWSALQHAKPYRVGSLFLCEANPVMQLPGGEKWREALARVPFLVVSAPFLDESAAQADLVLPAPVFLETWDESPSPPGCAFAVESVAAPAARTRAESRHPGDVLLAVGRSLNGAPLGSLPFSDFAGAVAHLARTLFEQQRGYVFSSTLESTWDRLLQRTGWWAPSYASADELWTEIVKHGGWWDPGAQEGFSRLVPAGRLQFLPEALPEWPSRVLAQARQHPERSDAAAYPLLLEPFEVLPLLGGLGAEAPFLAQTLGQHLGEGWHTWVEMHPETGARLGVADRQWVWVESSRGRIRARARLRTGLHPDVIGVPVGLGRTEGSRWSNHRGAAPADLLAPDFDPQTALPRWWGEPVRVYPA